MADVVEPVRVNSRLHDGSVLDFAGGAHVISTPGHTDGSIALYLPAHRVCLTGDIAAEHPGLVVLGPFNLDSGLAACSLRRVAALVRLRQAAETASS